MAKKIRYSNPLSQAGDLFEHKIQFPLAIICNHAGETIRLLQKWGGKDTVCFFMDTFAADQLQELAQGQGLKPQIELKDDLWDLSRKVKTILYAPERGGEKNLKMDLVEQSYHVLEKGGRLIVVSPYAEDQLFPQLLKRIYGKYQAPSAGEGKILIAIRGEDRKRKRHEVLFQIRFNESRSLRFITRPGVFSYGKFDDGSRALVEAMEIQSGDRILDLGCGCGTNGIIAGIQSQNGEVLFLDSNMRALALAEINAQNNGLENFRTRAGSRGGKDVGGNFDVVLANPPYFASQTLGRFFVEYSHGVLRPRGKLFLVTKHGKQMGELTEEFFRHVDIQEKRGYYIVRGKKG